jgi:hypothetical protein
MTRERYPVERQTGARELHAAPLRSVPGIRNVLPCSVRRLLGIERLRCIIRLGTVSDLQQPGLRQQQPTSSICRSPRNLRALPAILRVSAKVIVFTHDGPRPISSLKIARLINTERMLEFRPLECSVSTLPNRNGPGEE